MSEANRSAGSAVAAQLLECASGGVLLEGLNASESSRGLEFYRELGFLAFPYQPGDTSVTIVGFNIDRGQGNWKPSGVPQGYDPNNPQRAAQLWRELNKGGKPDERIYNSPAAVAGRQEPEAYEDDLAVFGVRITLSPELLQDMRPKSQLFQPNARTQDWIKRGLADIDNLRHLAAGRMRASLPGGKDAVLAQASRQYTDTTRVAFWPQTLSGRRHQLMRRAWNSGVEPAFAVLLDRTLKVERFGTVPAYGKLRTVKREDRRRRTSGQHDPR